jgi:hypothetical protein
MILTMLVAMAAGAAEAKAAADSSLTEERLEQVANSKEASREQLEKQVQALTDSLSLANAEADFFRQQWQELRLRNEALGVDALTADEKRLEDRVVQAVKELYQTEKQRRETAARLQELIEAGQALIRTASNMDAAKRAEYEVALRSAKEFLAGKRQGPIPVAMSLKDGQILAVNKELNTVVINLGESQGVKPGMPFRIFRGDELIGQVKVFQVREQVSAALVERLAKKMELKKGDAVMVAAEK